MSVELQHSSEPGGNNASLQGTALGGSKPLHRFMQGQPKITGVVVIILGSSFFNFCASMMLAHYSSQISPLQPGIVLAILYLVSGSVYIVTENKPTKKTVTMSLALSIVSLLASCWIIFLYLPSIIHDLHRIHIEDDSMDNDMLSSEYAYMYLETASVQIFLLYTGVGGIIFIVMSFLAGAALRSTNSKAIVVMTATSAEPPVE